MFITIVILIFNINKQKKGRLDSGRSIIQVVSDLQIKTTTLLGSGLDKIIDYF